MGPAPLKRRRLSHAVLLASNKRAEDALIATSRQISHLERELEKETTLLDEDDAHLSDYLARMKANKAHHKSEHNSKLHPDLRKPPQSTLEIDDDALLALDKGGESFGAIIEDGNGEDDGNGGATTTHKDLLELRAKFYDTLGNIKGKAGKFETWLSAVHQIASLVGV